MKSGRGNRGNKMDKLRYLILGASSDVGIAYINHLVDFGANAGVIAQYRTMSDELEELSVHAKENGFDLKLIRADLSRSDDIVSLISYIRAEIECPDRILHLPAAKLNYRKIKDADWMGVTEDFNIQVTSLGRVLSAFLPDMAKRKYGRIAVMLSSVVCENPPKYMAEYAVVKNALWGLTKSASLEYSGKNVYITGISPAMMETKLLTNVDEKIVALNAANSKNGRNYTVEELNVIIDDILNEETDKYNGVNVYPGN